MKYELTPFRLLLDRVIPTARPHFRTILPTVCLPVVLVSLPMAWFQQRWMVLSTDLESEQLPANLFGEMAVFVTALLLMMLIYVGCYLALTVASMDAVMGRPVDMARAWKVSLRPSTLWTTFLYLTVVIAGFMMCVAPGLIAVPLLSLTLPVLVEEGKSGIAALRRSAQLVWWNGTGKVADSSFLQMGLLLFVGWLIQSATSGVAQVPLVLFQQYRMFEGISSGAADPSYIPAPTWLLFSTQVISALVAVVTWFYWTFGYSLHYRELQDRRYGADLLAGVERLEQDLAGGTGPDLPAGAEA